MKTSSALIVLGCVFAGVAIREIPFVDVVAIAGDLIATFAILAGLLAQMIALTAVIFEPGRLSGQGVREVGAGIDDLQRLNIGLFAIYLLAIFLLLAIKVLNQDEHATVLELGASVWLGHVSVEGSSLFITGFVVALAIVRTFRTLIAIRRLQTVRTNVQARDAEARERAVRESAASRLRPVPDEGGATYGTFIDPAGSKGGKPAKGRARG